MTAPFARLLASVRSALAANDRAWRGAPTTGPCVQFGAAESDREAQREGSVAQ